MPRLITIPVALFGVALVALMFATGLGAPQPAHAAGQVIDPTSCGGAPTYPNCENLPANVTIGANSCTFFDACDDLGDGVVIGDGSCTATDSCWEAGSGGSTTIGDGSCTTAFSCWRAGRNGSASVGDGSCTAFSACQFAGDGGSASVGSASCTAQYSCQFAGRDGEVTIGDGSCTADYSCRSAGHEGDATVGDSSCPADYACQSAGEFGEATIGDGSCSGEESCKSLGLDATGMVGSHSCNRNPNSTCPGVGFQLDVTIGTCALNEVAVPGCPDTLKPTVTATLIDESTGQPYIPGTPTRGPVKIRFSCSDEAGGSGIEPREVHGDDRGGNSYPAIVRVQRTQSLTLDPDWRCVDNAGNVADAPAGFPAAILIDRRAPSCSLVLSRTSVPKDGTPTSVTATVSGSDNLPGPLSLRVISISPAPTAGPALPDVSPGTWTLKGAFGKTFTFTAEVKDAAGNAKTCTKKVTSR